MAFSAGALCTGDGIAYHPTNGEIAACPSTDGGDIVSMGTDRVLYANAPARARLTGRPGASPRHG